MNCELKVGTWNLCLGLTNKKDIVKNYILSEAIDVCCLQETEIPKDYPNSLLTFNGYTIEIEKNTLKKRTAIYLNNKIKYERREDLEGENSHIIVIDILGSKQYRLISIYRTFRPPLDLSVSDFFMHQISLVKIAMTPNTVLLGDFNLDYARKYELDYVNKNMFINFDKELDVFNLEQVIAFPTWSREILGVRKYSILDHVYTTDSTDIANIYKRDPIFGDHSLIIVELRTEAKKVQITKLDRDWRNYSQQTLNDSLEAINWQIDISDVQNFWNAFEQDLLSVVDQIVPIVEFVNNSVKNVETPCFIKRLLNTRKRLLRRQKTSPNACTKEQIKQLNIQIKGHYKNIKSKAVRRGIVPGNSKSLWRAVKIAKDVGCSDLPSKMYNNADELHMDKLHDAFADFFFEKIETITNVINVEDDVYNGSQKLIPGSKMFMTKDNILECIKTIKVKNNEGYDRIPQRILVDGIDHLITPLTHLFSLIYNTKSIPDQWKIAKVIPLFKKGSTNQISNYRPISNLCAASKIFEKLILNRLVEIQAEQDVDITGSEQHGFKKQKSTATAGMILQTLISSHVDLNEYVMMASLDLSAAFDIVDLKLLVKRLKIIGLPKDVVDLIEVWLSDRSYFVSLNGRNSRLIDLSHGTIQGSILGPILYAIYVSPLFDLTDLTNFADDNFALVWSNTVDELVIQMQSKLEMIVEWLRKSGLKVNEIKTELCLFHRLDQPIVTINLNGQQITSKKTMNVLGVCFDSKLQWQEQVALTIKKAKSSLHAIKLIKPYFSNLELKQLITANFYSVLYYNSEIWHIPTLNPHCKQQLLSASANALKLCTTYYNDRTSFEDLHKLNQRATPTQIMQYKHSLLLYKLYNRKEPIQEWVNLNFQQTLSSRQTKFGITRSNNYKIGNNLLCNRLAIINNLIPLPWLNLSLSTYKTKCKELFLLN